SQQQQPDIVSINTVLGSLEAPAWHWALQLAEAKANQRTFNTAIDTCQAEWLRGLELLCRAQQVAVQLDVVSWNAAAFGSAKGLQWERSHALLARIAGCSLVPDSLSSVAAVSSCEKAACWQPALAVLEAPTPQSVVASNAAISAMATSSSPLWRSAMLLAKIRSSGQPDAACLGACIVACTVAHAWAASLLIPCYDALSLKSTTVALGHGRLWRAALLRRELCDDVKVWTASVWSTEAAGASSHPLPGSGSTNLR
ncbi:unnamed protein product, partial [Effrenium voratum]